MDRNIYEKNVIISCGRRTISSDILPNVQIWNLATNRIIESTDDKYMCPYTPSNDDGNSPVDEDGKFKMLNHNYLIYTNVRDNTQNSGELYFFTMKDGFLTGIANVAMNNNYGGDSFVAPKGTVQCATVTEVECSKGEYQLDTTTCEGTTKNSFFAYNYHHNIFSMLF